MSLNLSWFHFHRFRISYFSISIIFCLTVIWVTLTVIFFSNIYISHRNNQPTFLIWLNLFVIRMLILLIRNRWWLIFLGWEGLGLTSFYLVAFYRRWFAHNGRILTFITNRIGDACLIFSGIYWLTIANANYWNYSTALARILLLIAICSKRAQYPLISWLPAAMNAPTPVSALVHRRTLVTAGLFLAIKFNWALFRTELNYITSLIGLLTLLVGRWSALVETDFKKIVAFSTLRQLGLLFWILSTGNLILILFHLVRHAFFKRALFICVGTIIHYSFSNQATSTIRSGSLTSLTQITWAYITLLNLAAFPFLVGFYSKERALRSILSANSMPEVLILLFRLSLTIAYAWRLATTISQLSFNYLVSNHPYINTRISSALSILPLLGLGYFWRVNLHMINFHMNTWNLGLLLLVLIFYVASISYSYIFYSLTKSLKYILTFKFINSINSTFHLNFLPSFVLSFINWQRWLLLLIYILLIII